MLESKYIRYKKHNRDKASWTCVAHYRLRTTYPTVRKSIAVLMGQWSEPSKRLMNSFGVELVEIPFAHMATVLARHGVDFNWAESDNETPRRSWSAWGRLPPEEHKQIAHEIVGLQAERLRALVLEAIQVEASPIRNVDKIELLLKTAQGEYFVKRFGSVRETMVYLLQLTQDIDNLRGLLQ